MGITKCPKFVISVKVRNQFNQGVSRICLGKFTADLGLNQAERQIDYREVISIIDIMPKKPSGAEIGKFGGGKQTNLNLFKRDSN